MDPRRNGQAEGGLRTLRSPAARALTVLVTLALVLESSPVTQVAYALEAGGEAQTVAADASGDAQDDNAAQDGEDAQGDAETASEEQGSDESASPEAEADASDSNAGDGDDAEGEDAIALVSDEQGASLDPGTYGKYTYRLNTETNAFNSSEYDAYRDSVASAQLGLAGSFHITAFNQMNIESHVYGNVLTKKLSGSNNFGMDGRCGIYDFKGLSYIQDYPYPSSNTDAYAENEGGTLVIGSGNTVTAVDNNSHLAINGTKLDTPYTLVQDADTESNPFIDIDAVHAQTTALQQTLAARGNVGATSALSNEGKVRTITIDDGFDGSACINLTASELMSSYENIYIDNLSRSKGKTGLVINVDCSGVSSVTIPKTYLRINGKTVGIGEVDTEFGDTGYVLYNFYNSDGTSITVQECTASVLAPNASLTLGPGNACGTFIGNNVTVKAESHIRPFHGNVKPSDDDDDDQTTFTLSGYSMRAADGTVTEPDKVCYVDPKVVKALEGRALKAGEFSFQLIDDKTGAVVSTATNDEAGMVDFDRASDVSGNPDNPSCLSFTAAGTYTYTVRETPGQAKDPTVTYSTEVVKFVTVIGQNEDGSLCEQESYYLKYANAEDAAAGTNATRYASDEHPTITNTVKPLSLALTKTSAETGEGLAGATYALYRVDDSGANGAVQVMTATSDENGLMVFTATDASAIAVGGRYYFQEVSAPAGYTVSENRTTVFTIKMTGEGKYYLVYEDEAATCDAGDSSASPTYDGTAADPIVYKAGTGVSDAEVAVTIGKLSSDGSALSGAELAVRDASGNDVASWTTTAAGYVVKGLTSGERYTLYEKTAPDGYSKAAEVVFTVDEYGKVSILEGSTANDLTNAYAEGASLNLVDYKLNVREEQTVVMREKGTPSGKNGRMPQTGDVATYAGIILALGACLLLGGLARKLRHKL